MERYEGPERRHQHYMTEAACAGVHKEIQRQRAEESVHRQKILDELIALKKDLGELLHSPGNGKPKGILLRLQSIEEWLRFVDPIIKRFTGVDGSQSDAAKFQALDAREANLERERTARVAFWAGLAQFAAMLVMVVGLGLALLILHEVFTK